MTARSDRKRSLNLGVSEAMQHVLGFINDRQRAVLLLRYGLAGLPKCTLNEVAQLFPQARNPKKRVGRERIRQIEAIALRKLRHPSLHAKHILAGEPPASEAERLLREAIVPSLKLRPIPPPPRPRRPCTRPKRTKEEVSLSAAVVTLDQWLDTEGRRERYAPKLGKPAHRTGRRYQADPPDPPETRWTNGAQRRAADGAKRR